MASNKQDFLKFARDRFKQGTEADSDQRKRELEALRFYNLQQWDKDLLDSRKSQTLGSGSTQQVVPARPSLVIDRTAEPVRLILNQERQSEMGIELVPADDWGEMTGPVDHTEIELREGLVRRIQRDSEAADARSWAFERAVIAGRGYWLVMTRYVPGKSWDQEVYVHRIYNQAGVVLDPAHEQPDGSDARWGFVFTDIPWDQYKAEFGTRNGKRNRLTNHDLTDSEWRTLGDEAPEWFTDQENTRFVRVGDYYYEELTSRELCLLANGQSMWRDELPEDTPKDQITETRRVVEKQIKWAKIDGCDDDVLDEGDWEGHYLPFVKVLGEEIQPYDKERRARGVVEPMMGPCRGNNYIVSKFVERVGLTPIPPMIMAGGQDEGFEDEWNAANTRTLGRLHYNQKDQFSAPAPPPFRADARAEISDIAMGVQVFNDAIVSTSRVTETALGHVDSSVKSGKLANALIQQSEQGTSNYLDNLKRSMRHEARVVNDLLFPIYGRNGRLARMMNPAGKMTSVVIGQPFIMQGEGPQARPKIVPPGTPGAKFYGLTENAEFNVAVKVSRNTDTRRQQIVELIGQIVGNDPTQMQIIGDILWKYADAPEHEELEKRYKAVLAPPVQAAISGKPQIPPEVQAQMAQMQQQLAQAMELADKNKTDLMKAQFTEQQENQRTIAKLQSDERAQALDNLVKLAIAEISANAQMAQVHAEQVRTELGFAHEHAESERDRQMQAGEAERDREIQTSESARDRELQASHEVPA